MSQSTENFIKSNINNVWKSSYHLGNCFLASLSILNYDLLTKNNLLFDDFALSELQYHLKQYEYSPSILWERKINSMLSFLDINKVNRVIKLCKDNSPTDDSTYF